MDDSREWSEKSFAQYMRAIRAGHAPERLARSFTAHEALHAENFAGMLAQLQGGADRWFVTVRGPDAAGRLLRLHELMKHPARLPLMRLKNEVAPQVLDVLFESVTGEELLWTMVHAGSASLVPTVCEQIDHLLAGHYGTIVQKHAAGDGGDVQRTWLTQPLTELHVPTWLARSWQSVVPGWVVSRVPGHIELMRTKWTPEGQPIEERFQLHEQPIAEGMPNTMRCVFGDYAWTVPIIEEAPPF